MCATDTKSCEVIHRLQCDFPLSWQRMYDHLAPPDMASLEGVRSVRNTGKLAGEPFRSGIPVQLPPTLRSLRIDGEPSEEVWDALPQLPQLSTLVMSACSVTELRSEMLPDSLRVLRVDALEMLESVTSLSAHLPELSVWAGSNSGKEQGHSYLLRPRGQRPS